MRKVRIENFLIKKQAAYLLGSLTKQELVCSLTCLLVNSLTCQLVNLLTR